MGEEHSKTYQRVRELIAKSIPRWLYSRLSGMKTRNFIVRALLLALLLSPSGLRAFGSRVSLSSCHVRKPHAPARRNEGRASAVAHQLVVSLPGHRSPAQRQHRNRGKRISAGTTFVPATGLVAVIRLPLSNKAICQQELDGPNPSRGPPALLPL